MAQIQCEHSGRRYQVVEEPNAERGYRVVPGYMDRSDNRVLVTLLPLAHSDDLSRLIEGCQPLFAVHGELLGDLIDVGSCAGGAVLIHREPGGINLGRAIRAKKLRITDELASSLLDDCCAALAPLAAAELPHGDLRLSRFWLTAQKRIAVTLHLPAVVDELCPPLIRGVEAVAHAGHERLDTPPALPTLATDIYALGACLFELLCGETLATGVDAAAAARAVLGDELHVHRRLGETTQPLIDVVTCCLAPDPAHRYESLAALRSDLDAARAGHQAAEAKRISDRLAPVSGSSAKSVQTRSELFDVNDIEEYVRKHQAEKTATAAIPAKSPTSAREKILRDILTSKDGMCAWIVIGPDACFPREVLESLLGEAGITHGWSDGGMREASAPSDRPRKIILAEGTPPRPGVPGTTVLNGPIEALSNPVQIVVSDDGMWATAYTPPCEPVPRHHVQRALGEAGLSMGLDSAALQQLCEMGSETGQTVIARGIPVREPITATFRLLVGDAGPGGDSADSGPISVDNGTKLALWDTGEPGRPGMDVRGQAIPFTPRSTPDPFDYAGEGTRLGRYQNDVYLCAEISGAVQVMEDATIRVVPERAHHRDLGSDEPIDTQEVLVIHGDVLDGARIRAGSDCHILGDVGDAALEIAGNLRVSGTIAAGTADITVARALSARAITGRKLVCGELDVSQCLTNSDLVCTGDARIATIAGGSLTAAGEIAAGEAGDDAGTRTLLWAGHHIPNAVKRDMARLDEHRIRTERRRLSAERQRFTGDLQRQKLRADMYSVAGYMREEAKLDMVRRLKWLSARSSQLDAEMEESRHVLLARRQDTAELDETTENTKACITIERLVHPGVELRVAHYAGTVIEREEQGLRFGGV
ncbi:MAG: FapA family protein [Planctomycetota bacterium]